MYSIQMLLTIQNWQRGPYWLYSESEQTSIQYDSPVPNKWLPGDIVIDKNKVQRDSTRHTAIVGIVDYTNRTGQGFTSRNVPLYMFHPLNPAYPPMIVASKTNPKHNQLATVNIEHWDNKWPRAGIQKTLGPVGNIEIEQSAYIQAMSIGKQPEFTSQCHAGTLHTEYDAFVFHIDPEGCEDVDDVLSFANIPGGYEFGIGIADVSAWVPEDSPMDVYARHLGETVYVDGKPMYPMLPPALSTDKASLRADAKPRPVLSRIYTIQQDQVTDVRWALQIVRVHAKYTYESILHDSTLSMQLKKALKTVLQGKPITEDPHRWVELAMVEYNTAAANLLKQNRIGLLRRQPEGISQAEWLTLSQQTRIPELAFLGYGSGAYTCASTNEATKHAGLQLETYTHATSPLRRYADLHNQRQMKYILFGTQASPLRIDWMHLNVRSRQAKQLDRDLWFLQHLQPNQITEVEGIVVERKEDTWKLYVPSWKRMIRAKPEEDTIFKQGETVHIRAYTNLKAVTSNRIVCSCASHNEAFATVHSPQ